MAQLNDLLVLGKSALLGDVQFRYLKAPISSGSTTLGPGTAGQVLRTNGTTVYWGAEGQGPTGATGPKGATGSTGPKGATGSQGVQGATGSTGPKGATGSQGVQGATGSTGPKGATGSQGVQGATGLKGATGSQGVQGATGLKGATGTAGAVGATGATGPKGATGTAGAKGATGSTGPKGATGTTGSQGAIGYYIKATVDRPSFTEANWTTYGEVGHTENWSNTSNTGFRVGDLFLVVGTSTDGGKGHIAIYSYTGSSGGTTLSGDCIGHHIIAAKGNTGSAGAKGATGATGPKGATGSAGPTGATGATGPKGATGTSVTGATGPTGAKGATGATGPKGATGAAGSYTAGTGITISSSTIKMTVPHSVVASTSTSTPASGAIIWYYT